MQEKWKPIGGYEELYEISNTGRVKSYHHSHNGRIISPDKSNHGHLRIKLCRNGNKDRKLVHRLVAKSFIPNPDNKPQINHIDGNPANNNVNNLEWSTQSENIKHAYDIGNKSKAGEAHHMNKLSENDVLEIRAAYKLGCFLQKEIARAYGVRSTTISRIVNRKNWTHI